MCGINGIVTKENKLDILAQMTNESKNRGPDGEGQYVDKHIMLSHVLLAITENAQKSIQPWGDKKKVAFVGEIYNYRKLRESLKNEDWQTDSDTEVLYHGLLEKGVDFIRELNGMYAFAWYSFPLLYLVRDQCGVKPLYYYLDDQNTLYFSSSVKSLLKSGASRNLNHFAFDLYWSLGYVPGNLTLIESIKKVCPNEIISFNVVTKELKSSIVKENIVQQTFNVDNFRNRVSQTVEASLSGKRPIGLFLSGGLDSTTVLHELSKHQDRPQTFTTRFKCKNNIFNNDADVAFKLSKTYNTRHHELLVTPKNFIDAMPSTIDALEEPRYNRSSPAYYLMNQHIAQNGIIVTLSGDGGDEVFTGYPRHNLVKNGSIKEWCQITNLFKKGISARLSHKICEYMSEWIQPYGVDEVNKHLFLESNAHLPEDFLIRNDRLGMYFGMEARFPFVNRHFRNYVLGIPIKHKLNKIIMKNAYKDILPKFVINKKKTGWAIPGKEWMPIIRKSDYWKEVHNNPSLNKFLNKKLISPKHVWVKFYFLAWANHFDITL